MIAPNKTGVIIAVIYLSFSVLRIDLSLRINIPGTIAIKQYSTRVGLDAAILTTDAPASSRYITLGLYFSA